MAIDYKKQEQNLEQRTLSVSNGNGSVISIAFTGDRPSHLFPKKSADDGPVSGPFAMGKKPGESAYNPQVQHYEDFPDYAK